MRVTLKSFTPDALTLLLGTKSARMRGADPETMTEAERMDHWRYMLDTIRSPFEFVDYIFEIEGVSKNMTHQLVRTRTGAYQQETSRALEITEVVTPDAFRFEGPTDADGAPDDLDAYMKSTELGQIWHDAMADAATSYQKLLAAGAELQDARAVIPSNMATKIQAKFNLRTISDMAKNRLCPRTQGEYQQAFREMRRLILEVHPWAEPLIQVNCVATGQCAFPRWGGKVLEEKKQFNSITLVPAVHQCNFYRPWMDKSKEQEELRQVFWRESMQQANPVATNGKSM